MAPTAVTVTTLVISAVTTKVAVAGGATTTPALNRSLEVLVYVFSEAAAGTRRGTMTLHDPPGATVPPVRAIVAGATAMERVQPRPQGSAGRGKTGARPARTASRSSVKPMSGCSTPEALLMVNVSVTGSPGSGMPEKDLEKLRAPMVRSSTFGSPVTGRPPIVPVTPLVVFG